MNVDADINEGPAIDVVYTWVDGKDAKWREERQRYANKSDWTHFVEGRTRDNGELRYSLRSVLQNMRWVRCIYIVTPDQTPDFIDTSNGKIKVISQREIMSDYTGFPVYNSMAIETCLHKIRNLSDKFIYFNDDFFVGKPVSKATMLGSHGEGQFLMERRKLNDPRDELYQTYLRSTHDSLSRVYGDFERCNGHHVPHLFDRNVCYKVEDMWKSEFTATALTQFRDTRNVIFRIIYAYYVLYSNFGAKNVSELARAHRSDVRFAGEDEYVWIPLGSATYDYRARMRAALVTRPTFYCLADDMQGLDIGAQVEEAQAFMRAMQPIRSIVET